MDVDTILHGDALSALRTLPDESVHCCVTSPPYFGLRDYGVPGQIGLESSVEDYVARMVEMFAEVRRVLRNDGTLWLNLGESYSTGVGSDLTDCMHALIKGGVLLCGGRCTLTITAKSEDILTTNKAAPDGELTRLLGVQRITLKQGHDDFCQVLDLLDAECDVRVGRSVRLVRRDSANAEIVLDVSQGLRIVVTDGNTNHQAALRVAFRPRATKGAQRTLTVKESAEPEAEGVRDSEATRNTITLDTPYERFAQIDVVDETVTLGDTEMPRAHGMSNFRVTVARKQHLALTLCDGWVDLAVIGVRHLFASNRFGSLIHYSQLYDQSERKANTLVPKQELGVPDLVKRALMEVGWICRCTIIWAKKNCMPESVTDRPTRSHEYIFLLAKSERYYYDAAAIREPAKESSIARLNQPTFEQQTGGPKDPKTGNRSHRRVLENLHARVADKQRGHSRRHDGFNDRWDGMTKDEQQAMGANKRDVWHVATMPYSGAHFATFPPNLIEPCILAGCPAGGVVLDPFFGSGTVGEVAIRHSRHYLGIELNAAYIQLAEERLGKGIQRVLWSAS